MVLPIAAEINAGLVLGDQPDDGAELIAIRHAAVVVAPAHLSGIAANVGAR